MKDQTKKNIFASFLIKLLLCPILNVILDLCLAFLCKRLVLTYRKPPATLKL